MVSSLRPRTTHASVLFSRRIVRPTLTVKCVPLGVLTQFRHLCLVSLLGKSDLLRPTTTVVHLAFLIGRGRTDVAWPV